MKRNKLFSFVPLLLVLIILFNVSPLHSGRTDSNGGHYNRLTGEYHYHHGKGPHQHEDLNGDGIVNGSLEDCPIEQRSIIAKQIFKYIGISIVVILALFVVIVTIRSKMKAKERRRIEETERKQREIEFLKEKILMMEKYGGRSIEELVNIPTDSEIGKDNLPRVKGSESAWGDKYTFYTNYERTRYHYNHCRYAFHFYAQNAYNLRNKEPCRVCKPQLPDMQWVDEYKKIKAIKEKYHIDEEKT